MLRAAAGLAHPTVTISSDDCQQTPNEEHCSWTIRTDTIFKSHDITFSLNENKTDITMDGRRVDYIIHQPKSNQWVEVQTDDGNAVQTTITRTFEADFMRVDLMVNEVTAISIFRRRI